MAQAALEIGLSVSCLHHHAAVGHFNTTKLGNLHLIEREEWREFLKRHLAGEYREGRPSKQSV